MKQSKIFTKWSLFLEGKTDKDGAKNDRAEVKKEVDKILSQYFGKVRDIEYHKNFIEFSVDEIEYDLDYSGEIMKMEYSMGVLKKRKYAVALEFNSKEDGKLRFNIILTPTKDLVDTKKEEKADNIKLKWEFEREPVALLRFLDDQDPDLKIPYKWNDELKILSIKKKYYDEDKEELDNYISEEDGILQIDELIDDVVDDLDDSTETVASSIEDNEIDIEDDEDEVIEKPKKLEKPKSKEKDTPKIKTVEVKKPVVKKTEPVVKQKKPENLFVAKVCSKCNKFKEADEYRLHSTSGRPLTYCKECERDESRERNLKNKLKHKHIKTKSDFIGKK